MADTRVTVTGERITQAALRRGMWVNMAAGALGMGWVGMALGMPITMFMEALGATGVMIGLIVTIQHAAMIMQIPGAYVAERLSSRKPTWATATLIHRAVWIVPAIVPWFLAPGSSGARWFVLGTIAVSSVLAQAVTASWYSWMADLIPEQNRGRFWSLRQSVVMLAFLVASALAGRILDLFPDPRSEGGSFTGFSIVFTLAALLGCADIIVHLWVPEPKPGPGTGDTSLWKRILTPLRSRDFLWLTLCFGVWNFAIGTVGSFSLVYLKRDFAGVTYTHLAAIGVSASLGTVGAGFVWGRVMDVIGARASGAIAMFLGPLCTIVWFFMVNTGVTVPMPFGGTIELPQPVLLLLVVNLVAGAVYSGVGLSQLNLTAAFAPRTGRTMAMAVHWTLIGAVGAFGPIVGGWVADWVAAHPIGVELPTGTRIAFFHVLVVLHVGLSWFVAIPLLMRVSKHGREIPIRFLAGNPLRSISTVYNLVAVSAAGTPEKRAKAVRRLGAGRTSAAADELIRRLEDPAADVREEAALALGRIGTPEAVEALVEKLEDPHSDLGPQIARALREARSPDSVDALVRKLGDNDRETIAESARALGEIGDERAAESLLGLLQQTHDAKVLSASSDALARLGEIAAIYEILPHLRATQNPVLRRSLAVAVADLLGPPGEFYALLASEEADPGKAAAGLLADLRKALKTLTPASLSAQTTTLADKAMAVEDAYEDGDMERMTDLQFDLAVGLADIHYGIRYGGHAEGFIEQLVWRDQRFGVGVWYLDLLRDQQHTERSAQGDRLEALLGLHFLCAWSRANLTRRSDAGDAQSTLP